METPTYTYIENLNETLPDVPADSILSRVFFKAEGLNATLFRFAAGQSLTEHTAARPAVLYFLAGECTLTLGEDEHHTRPGTWVYMPPHLRHAIEAETDTTLLLLLLP